MRENVRACWAWCRCGNTPTARHRNCPAASSSVWRRPRDRLLPRGAAVREPLSNLDAKLRAEMRVELRELQRRLDITSLYVTHDQEEALAISDRVIVMNGGRIEQIGSPEEIYNRPRSRFVADFVGSANLIRGRCAAAGVGRNADLRGGRRHAAGGHRIGRVARRHDTVALRSSYIHLGTRAWTHERRAGRIHRRMFHGDFIQYVVDWPAGQ